MVLFEDFEEITLNPKEVDYYNEILKEPSKIDFDFSKNPNQVRQTELKIKEKNTEIKEQMEK